MFKGKNRCGEDSQLLLLVIAYSSGSALYRGEGGTKPKMIFTNIII